MHIQFGEKVIKNVIPQEQSTFFSKHTNNQLREFEIELQVSEAGLDSFEKELDYVLDNGAWEIDENNGKIAPFNVSQRTRSNTFGTSNTTYIYVLRFVETEKLVASKLVINGIELKPYEYEEVYDDGIVITAKIQISSEEDSQLEDAIGEETYFSVVRLGISNEAIRMRFGQVLWSKIERKNHIKKLITLVEDKYDIDERNTLRGFNYPEINNLQKIVAYHMAYKEKLQELLIKKGVLSSEELDDLDSSARKDSIKKSVYFYEVNDIDEE